MNFLHPDTYSGYDPNGTLWYSSYNASGPRPAILGSPSSNPLCVSFQGIRLTQINKTLTSRLGSERSLWEGTLQTLSSYLHRLRKTLPPRTMHLQIRHQRHIVRLGVKRSEQRSSTAAFRQARTRGLLHPNPAPRRVPYRRSLHTEWTRPFGTRDPPESD
jgi:hypothetical protein